MSEIPYSPTPGKMKTYFDKIREVGVPETVNTKWLASIGFRGGNDYYFIKILKYINFIDSSGKPTELWKRHKSPSDSSKVLAEGIKTSYKELFSTYPDAYKKDRNVLYSYFSTKTGLAEGTVNAIVGTFTNMSALADFEGSVEATPPTGAPATGAVQPGQVLLGATTPPTSQPGQVIGGKRELSVNVNVQVNLPEHGDAELYDKIFAAIKKHLFPE